MLKDILDNRVEDIMIGIVPQNTENPYEDLWDVYLFNLYEETLKGVMIVSKGYGEINGEARQTAVFRHFAETISPLDDVLIEPIHPDVFCLANEFWVSFSLNGQLLDKKYVFVPGTIHPDNFIEMPFIGKRGVAIR